MDGYGNNDDMDFLADFEDALAQAGASLAVAGTTPAESPADPPATVISIPAPPVEPDESALADNVLHLHEVLGALMGEIRDTQEQYDDAAKDEPGKARHLKADLDALVKAAAKEAEWAGSGATIYSAGNGEWFVPSATTAGKFYMANENGRCTCLAGLKGRAACWHSWVAWGAANQTSGLYSPDARQIAFSWDSQGPFDLYRRDVGSAGEPTPLLVSGDWKYPESWSPDGRFLSFTQSEPGQPRDIWVLPMTGGARPFPIAQTPAEESGSAFSPDGRFLAYVSDESGRPEVLVRTFPASTTKWQVSTGGGASPVWRGDGKELFYLTPDLTLSAGPTALGPGGLDPGTGRAGQRIWRALIWRPPAASWRRDVLRGSSAPLLFDCQERSCVSRGTQAVRALALSITPRLIRRSTATHPRDRNVFAQTHCWRPLAARIANPGRGAAALSSAIRTGWARRQVLPRKGGVAWRICITASQPRS